MRRMLLLSCLLGAGPAWAGSAAMESPAAPAAIAAAQIAQAQISQAQIAQAWLAEYRVHDAQGDRTLVLVRGDDRVEYRLAGEPVRVWEKVADGLVHREVFLDAGRVVSYAPGDLRALGRTPGWPQLSHLVDPDLRAQLGERGVAKVRAAHDAQATRYRGKAHGVPVELDWLDAADLPATYRSGQGKTLFAVELRSLRQVPVAQAFTVTEGLREIDYADIGDMELDPFARQYIREGAGHADAGH